MDTLTSELIKRWRDAETCFMGAAFLRPDLAREQCGWLVDDMLFDDLDKRLWQAILRGDESVAAALDIDQGYMNKMLEVSGNPEYSFNYQLKPYADKLTEQYWMVKVSENLSHTAKALKNNDADQSRQILSDILKAVPNTVIGIPNSIDVALDFVTSLDEENNTLFTGTPLDRALGGLWRSTLSIVCARPSVGKTALAFQVGRGVASAGYKVLFASMEMSQRALWARAACGAARIPYRDVLAKKITEQQKQHLIECNAELIDTYQENILIDDRQMTTQDLWRSVAAVKPDLLIVDHIRLFRDKNDNEVKRLGDITQSLKWIAKEYKIHVMALAQLNRQLESRTDKEPQLNDLRDSGQIEENADFVLGLHRDRVYLEHAQEKTPAKLIVMKFRDGPSSILINLIFDGLGQWFDEPKRTA
jgi:replicative DNA helicase